jgi:hypothetical protein
VSYRNCKTAGNIESGWGFGKIRSLAHLTPGDIDQLRPEHVKAVRKLDDRIPLDAAWPHSAEVRQRLFELEREMRARPRDDRSSADNQPSAEKP